MASVLGLTLRVAVLGMLFGVILMLGDKHEDIVYRVLRKP